MKWNRLHIFATFAVSCGVVFFGRLLCAPSADGLRHDPENVQVSRGLKVPLHPNSRAAPTAKPLVALDLAGFALKDEFVLFGPWTTAMRFNLLKELNVAPELIAPTATVIKKCRTSLGRSFMHQVKSQEPLKAGVSYHLLPLPSDKIAAECSLIVTNAPHGLSSFQKRILQFELLRSSIDSFCIDTKIQFFLPQMSLLSPIPGAFLVLSEGHNVLEDTSFRNANEFASKKETLFESLDISIKSLENARLLNDPRFHISTDVRF